MRHQTTRIFLMRLARQVVLNTSIFWMLSGLARDFYPPLIACKDNAPGPD